MKFNINEVLAQMIRAIKGEVKEDFPLVKGTANDFLQSRKLRLELLASLRLKNQISEEFFEDRLADEKDILESELHAIAIIGKVAAQNAANAAMAVLQKAVDAVIKI
ncbi:MAG: hypothetical protein ABIO81_05720 [Ginsengibacter sp.]